MKTKLEIVTGFLGSGKTSFINSYLDTDICLEENILIVLLEKGVQDIREDLKHIKVIYLESIENLKDILLKEAKNAEYSKIIVEFNGTTDLSLIGEVFKDKEVKKRIDFYGNYYIGDCKNLLVYLKNISEIIIPFIQSSKLIILNNLDNLESNKQKELLNNIENINQTAPILCVKSLITVEDLKLSKYFRKSILLKKIKKLLYKKEVEM